MKLIVSRKDLKDAVSKVYNAVPPKAQTPILNGILFKTSNNAVVNSVELQATDFSISIKARIPAEVEVAGSAVIGGKKLADILPKLSGEIVTLETVDNQIILTNDASKFELYTMDAQDFPEIVEPKVETKFFIKCEDLKQLIRHTSFAVADKSDGRAVFQGVQMTFGGHNLQAVATNTHRLAVDEVELDDETSGNVSMIIPANALNIIARILPEVDKGCELKFNDKHFSITAENFNLTTRLIDGQFPPIDALLKVESKYSGSTDLRDLKAALERVKIISKDTEYNTVHLKFDDEGLEMSAESFNSGKVVEHLNSQGEGAATVALNADYLSDILRVTAAEELKFVISEPLKPALFYGEGEFKNIITPIRTA
ncbi:MAG: DNA polymerase III subunit beta [Selenomonadaceae bacterium]|nr:DNA polymerase III subunit beta [Selenomonadaceae bacterium]